MYVGPRTRLVTRHTRRTEKYSLQMPEEAIPVSQVPMVTQNLCRGRKKLAHPSPPATHAPKDRRSAALLSHISSRTVRESTLTDVPMVSWLKGLQQDQKRDKHVWPQATGWDESIDVTHGDSHKTTRYAGHLQTCHGCYNIRPVQCLQHNTVYLSHTVRRTMTNTRATNPSRQT